MKYVKYILLILLITVGTALITYSFCFCLKSDNPKLDSEIPINNVDKSEDLIDNSNDELDIDSNLDNVTDVDNNTTSSENKNTSSNKEQSNVKKGNSKVENNTSKKEENKQEIKNNNSSSNQESNVSNNATGNNSSNNNSNSTANNSSSSNNDNNNSKPDTPKVDEPSKDPTAWEELGISEYDYYNKPIWSWARIDFSIDDYGTEENTHNACISKGNQLMEESNNGLGFSCQSILSYAGNYLGEMMKTF